METYSFDHGMVYPQLPPHGFLNGISHRLLALLSDFRSTSRTATFIEYQVKGI
jgi:hypothetical protein